jgi:hypothetical protein
MKTKGKKQTVPAPNSQKPETDEATVKETVSDSKWFAPIVTSAIGSVVTTALAFSLWTFQFGSQIKNEFLARKLLVIESLTGAVTKDLYLRPFKIFVIVEMNKRHVRLQAPVNDADEQLRIVHEVEHDHPFEYKQGLLCDDNFPDLQKSLSMTQVY